MMKHEYYLDDLIKNLHVIDERKQDICWLMREGIYYKMNSFEQNKFCDLIIGYYDGFLSLIELKGSSSKRVKALNQLRSSYELVRDKFVFNDLHAKIVYYDSRKGYSYELIGRDDLL